MIIFGLGSLSIIIYYMKIKSYLWILFFHVIVSSGCGISKNPSTLIIDSPENSKVKKEVKDNLSHYHIIFAEKDNQLTISQMPYPPSPVFISTFIETFTKSFKVELNKQLEALGLELKTISKKEVDFKGSIYKAQGVVFHLSYSSPNENSIEAIYIINDGKKMWQVSFSGDEQHLGKTNQLLKNLKNPK